MPLPGAESAFLFSCQVINPPTAIHDTQRLKKKASSIKLRKMPSLGLRAAAYLGFDVPKPAEEEEESRSPVLMPEVHGSLVSVVEQEALDDEPIRSTACPVPRYGKAKATALVQHYTVLSHSFYPKPLNSPAMCA